MVHLKDAIDAAWITQLAERFDVTRRIGVLKKHGGLPARDPNRESRQAERVRLLARDVGICPELAQAIFMLIAETVVEEHRKA